MIVAIGIALASAFAWAGPAPTETLASRFNPTMPNEFNQLEAQGFATTFTSCLGPQIGNMLGNAGDACERVTLETECKDLDVPDQAPEISCPALMAGGKPNERAILKMNREFDDLACALRCRNAKVKLITTELKCLADQSQIFSQQIGSVQQSFLQNIDNPQNGYRAKMQEAISMERERGVQIARTAEILNGKEGGGVPGLVPMQKKLESTLAEMKRQIKGPGGFRSQLEMIRRRERLLKDQVELTKMNSAVTCFQTDTSRGSNRCPKGGPILSPMEFILCRYEQEQSVGSNGTISTNKAVLDRAAKGKENLRNLFRKMFTFTAKLSSVPDPTGAGTGGAPTSEGQIRSVQALRDRFEATLKSFNAPSFNVAGAAFSTMGSCYRDREGSIDEQLRSSRPGTVGEIREQILENHKDLSSNFDSAMTGFAQVYTDATRALTGVELPVNVSLYRDQKPETQIQFLNAMETNMEAALRGTPGVRVAGFEGAMTTDFKGILVKGANPALNINVACQGLNQCITKLNNLDTNLKTEMQKIGEAKTRFVQQANANITGFAHSIAQQLQPQSGRLRSKVDALNKALVSVGADPSLSFENVEDEPPEPDAELGGLFKAPKNALNFIGSKMNPKMMKIDGQAFTSAGSGIKSTQSDIVKKLALVRADKNRLAAEVRRCMDEGLQKEIRELSEAQAALEEVGCGSAITSCGLASADPINRLTEAINAISSENLDLTSALASLSSGISEHCTDSGPKACAEKVKEEGGFPEGRPTVRAPCAPNDSACSSERTAEQGRLDAYNVKLSECERDNKSKASKCRSRFSSVKSKVTQIGNRAGQKSPLDTDEDDGESESGR